MGMFGSESELLLGIEAKRWEQCRRSSMSMPIFTLRSWAVALAQRLFLEHYYSLIL